MGWEDHTFIYDMEKGSNRILFKNVSIIIYTWIIKLSVYTYVCMHTYLLSRFSCVWLCATLWTLWSLPGSSVHGIFQQELEYWRRLPCPAPGDHLNQGIDLLSLTSPILAGGFFPTSATWEAPCIYTYIYVFYVQIARVYTLNHLVSILPKHVSFSFLTDSTYSPLTVHNLSLCT